jgi:Secretion system C-terminal sorting domain
VKKIAILIAICLLSKIAIAQNELYNNGTTLQVNTGCLVQVNGALINKSGSTFTNNGTVTITGNVTNDATESYNAGTLEFKGTTAQSLNGTAEYSANNVLVNNAAGVTLNSKLKVDGMVTFANGIVTASTTAAPLWFTANGTHANTADISHVNGYVVKEGTGSFTYPVGDGTKYQKVEANLSANGTGMLVKYNAADAGAGTFTTTGTEATALQSYNSNEYWDISPLSTATGAVTIYWDGTNDSNTGLLAQRKVAHLTGGSWLNEGTTGAGTVSVGNVTSNNISAWSPFTLGLVPVTTLPVRLLFFTGKATDQGNQLTWKTASEVNFSHFEIEKSENTSTYNKIGSVKGSKGEAYEFVDASAKNAAYYRLKMVDIDGSSAYSKVIFISAENEKSVVGEFYPNPTLGESTNIIINSTNATNWTITSFDLSGKVLNSENKTLNKGENKVKVTLNPSKGMQIVRFESNGFVQHRKVINE